MKFFRQVFILFFATVIFTGTVGIDVFAHYCKIDGVDYSFILPKEGHCKKEEEIKKTCCLDEAKVLEERMQLNENCCSDEVTSFKISSEIFQKEMSKNQVVALATFVPSFIYTPASIDVEPDFSYFNFRQPIPKWGRELLIQNQFFRI